MAYLQINMQGRQIRERRKFFDSLRLQGRWNFGNIYEL
jgi:hypothetical protein